MSRKIFTIVPVICIFMFLGKAHADDDISTCITKLVENRLLSEGHRISIDPKSIAVKWHSFRTLIRLGATDYLFQGEDDKNHVVEGYVGVRNDLRLENGEVKCDFDAMDTYLELRDVDSGLIIFKLENPYGSFSTVDFG